MHTPIISLIQHSQKDKTQVPENRPEVAKVKGGQHVTLKGEHEGSFGGDEEFCTLIVWWWLPKFVYMLKFIELCTKKVNLKI